ncbi:EAL domain-containing protein [Thalassotalea ponticola]|uniref:bifunctional diguanylate cyclase/phosphodiesterase n=1 Tax=Thalassotalea ponticola TaxID=1523392 RepID=UPI0025B56A65|nr:EAL domain-containing protein [Thalassotalea ponticola]MDN3651696.1 EAL domain-containing protein [Thalassotalea ponticola]
MTSLFSSLRNRAFLLFALILVSIQAISLIAHHYSIEQRNQQQLLATVDRAQQLVSDKLAMRSRLLSTFAQISASDQALIDQFASPIKNVSLALNNYRKHLDADLALAIDTNGVIFGQLEVKDSNKEIKRLSPATQLNQGFGQTQWLKDHPVHAYYVDNKRVYQLLVTPILQDFVIIGHVAVGFELNQTFFDEIAKLTGFHLAINHSDSEQWLITSNSLAELHTAPSISEVADSLAQGQLYGTQIALSQAEQPVVNLMMFQTKAELSDAVALANPNSYLVPVLTLLGALLGAYFIQRYLASPISALINQVKNITNGQPTQTQLAGATAELHDLAEQVKVMERAIGEREDKIYQEAYCDIMTGLPNRSQFYREMESIKEPYLLCQVNVRRIVEINDNFGHDVGDDVISEVAHRLSKLSQPIYHISGNGFLLRFDHKTQKDINSVVEDINRVFEPAFIYQTIAIHLEANIGVTVSDGWSQPKRVLKESDSAMQLAKRDNLNFQVYDRQIDLNTLDRLQLVNRLNGAIDNDEFMLLFQPKLDLSSHCIDGVEALLRWNHPVNGLITPDNFIHTADKTGQITALSKWVVDKCIEQHLEWRNQGIVLQIAINISQQNLLDSEFCQYLIDKLSNDHGIREMLSFEICEKAFDDHSSAAVDNIIKLHRYGINLVIDNYGTGYSSLAQLRFLPVKELNIDKTFIDHVMQQPNDQKIVVSMINLAHQLNLRVVAKGVEDQATITWLSDNQCDMVQGYVLSRALSSGDLIQWLTTSDYRYKQLEQQSRV